MIPKNRQPTSPGEMLREEFLAPLGITQKQLADAMGVPVQRVNLILNQKSGVTADTAQRLAAVLGTTPEFWLHLQMSLDLWKAKRKAPGIAKLRSLRDSSFPAAKAVSV